jgi:acetyl esterase/lipase
MGARRSRAGAHSIEPTEALRAEGDQRRQLQNTMPIATRRRELLPNQPRVDSALFALFRPFSHRVLVCALVVGAVGCEAPYDVQELSYDPSIGYLGEFDFYEPKADSARTNRPAILAIHGGGFQAGDKPWGAQFAKEFCPYGYVVLSINYRLAGRPNGNWPAQIQDVQKALKHIRANAERFRIDPNRIASLGVSAGGHLASMVALRDDPAGPQGRVSVAVNLDGQSDMTMRQNNEPDELLTRVLGHGPPWTGAELRDFSPVTFARADVSVLTIHGAGDDDVSVDQGDRITAVLRAAGAETEFVRIEGREGNCHSDCWKVPRARRALHSFLGRKLAHDGNGFFEEKHGTKRKATQ